MGYCITCTCCSVYIYYLSLARNDENNSTPRIIQKHSFPSCKCGSQLLILPCSLPLNTSFSLCILYLRLFIIPLSVTAEYIHLYILQRRPQSVVLFLVLSAFAYVHPRIPMMFIALLLSSTCRFTPNSLVYLQQCAFCFNRLFIILNSFTIIIAKILDTQRIISA